MAGTASPFPLGRPAPGLLGGSDAMRAVTAKIATYGPADAPVLVTGETGTGKELVARALHAASPRRTGPLLAFNCAAVSEDLAESELFGHERGSFTGAHASHKGRFERAAAGTLFLDEVGDLPARTQAKLLRVLEDGTFERVGGERELRADVRVVAATNASLERGVSERWFREDLFHRIAVLRIHVPPLRDRIEDLPVLADHFLAMFNARYGKVVRRLTPEALGALARWHWPGNVRELRNVLERLHVEAQGDAIGRNALLEWESERDLVAAAAWNVGLRDEQRAQRGFLAPPSSSPALGPVVDLREGAGGWTAPPRSLPAGRRAPPRKLTDDAIRAAYRESGGNLTHAADLLGVHKATLYRHLRRLGLDRGSLEG